MIDTLVTWPVTELRTGYLVGAVQRLQNVHLSHSLTIPCCVDPHLIYQLYRQVGHVVTVRMDLKMLWFHKTALLLYTVGFRKMKAEFDTKFCISNHLFSYFSEWKSGFKTPNAL